MIRRSQPEPIPKFLVSQADEFIRQRHANGDNDHEIARALGVTRQTICYFRRANNLPANTFNDGRRKRLRESLRLQLRDAGARSLGALKRVAMRTSAAAAGWPCDLCPREVEVLNLLEAQVGMTRRELAKAMGLALGDNGRDPFKASHLPGGTVLASLQRRGLIVVDAHRNRARGCPEKVYALAEGVGRKRYE